MTQKSHSHALACFMAGIVGSIVIMRIGHRFLINWIPFVVQIAIAAFYFTGTLVYIFIWKRKAARQQIDSGAVLGFWHGVLRYFIALDLCMFGFQKIFHLQFAIPLGMLDNPFSSLSGEEMMWAFFGHFYAFTVIIACLQFMGAIMLLFRKTRLLAVIFLLPLLFNILLLDYFYNLGMVVNVYITILVIAMIYLLLLDYDRLAEFFLKAKDNAPVLKLKSPLLKNVIRLSIFYIPLLLLAGYKFPKSYPRIMGKYEVKSVLVNNTDQKLKPCRDSLLTKIFIDNYDFVMEYNNYQARLIGSYQYNEQTRQLKAIWRYPVNMHDTLNVHVADGKIPGSRIMSGRMGKDVIKIDMQKVN
ncbi:hypothetical protein [Mucilaginibacter pocheonensis]|nr:hypothetical protein [Mucilaginibacter pocheonensis]MDR6945198.1 hypothetical protein [Mucilaginibacter pocheonensis]